MAMCRPCSLERYGWLMIGMGDRGILIFVSEPLLTFFPETKSGFYVWDIIEKFGECGGLVQCRWCICDDGFLSLRVNIRIVNDSHVCFLLCDTCTIYGSIWKIQRNWFKTYFWDNLCVCVWNWKLWPSDQLNTPAICLWCLGTRWFLFGKCDLRWVLFKLQDSRSWDHPSPLGWSVCQNIPFWILGILWVDGKFGESSWSIAVWNYSCNTRW